MPKSFVLGNGNILVGLDRSGQVKDFYFPYVGLENHMAGSFVHRIGVWVDGVLSWLSDGQWSIEVGCEEETFASNIKAVNEHGRIELEFNDIVYNEKDIFVRSITLHNRADHEREVKLYINQEFELYESHRGDTAYFDSGLHVIIHYKGRRAFLINSVSEKEPFHDYSIGLYGIEGKEGTFKDAEDGILSKNPIEHGRVDSVIGYSFSLQAQASRKVYYWITVAKSIQEVCKLNTYVIKRSPSYIVSSAKNFWHAWVKKENFTFYGLNDEIIALFKKSLFIIRAHADTTSGSILASGDSDMLQHGRDTYSYMWPRDGALSVIALDKVGDRTITQRFFEFCNEVLDEEGYLLHKYRADKSLGSSWHPWVRYGRRTLPIQEDETALVLHALWKHYEISHDVEFIERLYNPFIRRAAEFMKEYRDKATKLPRQSYDLWEERFGVSTFTSSAVYGAMNAAAKFATLLGKKQSAALYEQVAQEVKEAILTHLYDKEEGIFYKMVTLKGSKVTPNRTLDMSSMHAIWRFGVLDVNDKRVVGAMKHVEDRLCIKTSIQGVPRYEGDVYFQVVPGIANPWFITTLWYAQYFLARATSEKDLAPVKAWLSWACRYALPSGVLSEQIHPHTGQQLSAAPLTWSHAEFVLTVIEYLEKLESLGICKVRDPVK